jgi:hypothetical protein
MSPAEQHRRAELASLQDVAMIIEDRAVAEQVIRVSGVIIALRELHEVDPRQRCLLCRPAGRRVVRRRRQSCTVHEVFDTYRLTVPARNGEKL